MIMLNGLKTMFLNSGIVLKVKQPKRCTIFFKINCLYKSFIYSLIKC